jgi:uncharacterized protein YkwD
VDLSFSLLWKESKGIIKFHQYLCNVNRSQAIKVAIIFTVYIVFGIILGNEAINSHYSSSLLEELDRLKVHAFEQQLGIKSGAHNNNNLVQYALERINEDRIKYNSTPINISHNEAAQIHAQDLLEEKYEQPSHWTTDGMKPYMKYSQYNGTGYVEQNIAIKGYNETTIRECENDNLICDKIDPYKEIENIETKLIGDDLLCCQNKHRNNILNQYHTHVSIGIASNDYYFALVQNFENNYINLDRQLTQDTANIHIAGNTLSDQYKIDSIGIYYDKTPTELSYIQGRENSSYALGKLVAIVVKSPPLFTSYKEPSNYTIIEAKEWMQDGTFIDIMFDLSPVSKADGVYTIVTYMRDKENNKFPVTSYSIFK